VFFLKNTTSGQPRPLPLAYRTHAGPPILPLRAVDLAIQKVNVSGYLPGIRSRADITPFAWAQETV
jgi:hypothetical protein